MDYLTEIDIGIWEQRLDDATWALWVDAKRDIAAAALAHGGSISACHGSCREGEVDLVPDELGRGFQVMLDPEENEFCFVSDPKGKWTDALRAAATNQPAPSET